MTCRTMTRFFFAFLMLIMQGHLWTLAEEETASPPKEEAEAEAEAEASPEPEAATPKKPPPPEPEDTFDASNTDWGSYYDPKSIFCGNYDCYKILGFDYDSFGKNPPTTRLITKRYRKLSREWHPDKSKHRNAKERFVKIARAYEVLTSVETRKEYDDLRFNQEAYVKKYGSSVLWSYAPKSDVTIVLIVIFILSNVFSWYSQKHRWNMVAKRLIKAAVEDWTTAQGGSPESKQLREEALKILSDKTKEKENGDAAAVAASPGNSKKQKNTKKESAKEKKKQEQEALMVIVTDLVEDMHDFGGGFHKPTWEDLMVVHLIRSPFKMSLALIWNINFYIRRLQKKELSDEEREVLTERAVGPVVWDTKSDDERQAMVKRELWVTENLTEWQSEEDFKNLSSAEQKQINKMKKKGKAE